MNEKQASFSLHGYTKRTDCSVPLGIAPNRHLHETVNVCLTKRLVWIYGTRLTEGYSIKGAS
jgi:hypothetical protein